MSSQCPHGLPTGDCGVDACGPGTYATQSTAVTLECPHCGGVAIESPDGMFGDGDGEACMTCGFPGHVSIDDADEENVTADWSPRDWDENARCTEDDCEECR